MLLCSSEARLGTSYRIEQSIRQTQDGCIRAVVVHQLGDELGVIWSQCQALCRNTSSPLQLGRHASSTISLCSCGLAVRVGAVSSRSSGDQVLAGHEHAAAHMTSSAWAD
jgi:hypothetical protein